MQVTAIYTIGFVVLTMGFGLAIALLLDVKLPGIRHLREQAHTHINAMNDDHRNRTLDAKVGYEHSVPLFFGGCRRHFFHLGAILQFDCGLRTT